MGGYVEGWATYIESYAYLYGSENQQLGRLHWLNRAMNLCLYSLLDIGIHYYGWTCEKAAKYLENFGVSDRAVCREIFQIIVEDPANYLKYYGGCLKFMDLKEEASRQEDFHPIDFHEKCWKPAPVSFPSWKNTSCSEGAHIRPARKILAATPAAVASREPASVHLVFVTLAAIKYTLMV